MKTKLILILSKKKGQSFPSIKVSSLLANDIKIPLVHFFVTEVIYSKCSEETFRMAVVKAMSIISWGKITLPWL